MRVGIPRKSYDDRRCYEEHLIFFLAGFSEEYTNTARIDSTCLTESKVKRDLLGRVFATKSPSAVCRLLNDWFMPKTMAEQVK